MDLCARMMHFFRRHCTVVLLSFWILGSISGIILAVSLNADIRLLVYNAVSQPLLPADLLLVLFPFLIGTLAVYSSETWMLPVLGFLKVFAFSFVSCTISMVFGDSGWLIRFLLLFSDIFLVPACCVFCLRYFTGNHGLIRREWFIWFLIALIVGCIDFFVVSPFLLTLFL